MESSQTSLEEPKPAIPDLVESVQESSASDADPEKPSQHEHSGSMVTIRLSDNLKSTTENATLRKSLEPTVKEQLGDPDQDNQTQESSKEVSEVVESPIDEVRTKSVIPDRLSKVRFEEEVEQLDHASEPISEGADHQPACSQISLPANEAVPQSEEVSDNLEQPNSVNLDAERNSTTIRSNSMGSSDSGSTQVDWAELDKNEEQEQRDEGTDESTAFLLARLEQENNALAHDPKAGLAHTRARSPSRPPSYQQLKKLVLEPSKPSLRYSLLPNPPPMTELEFWSALVSNYSQTAQRLPTLTSNKIRTGVPPPLRSVVWMSIAGARESFLEDEYERLSSESSPYEKMIHKDVGRSFPGVDMFRDPDGEGQKMLSKVLNAFSLWDQDIGYCQGLGFVVGPLLMHMGDKEAFCVLVRLMEHYDLRSCFLPNLSGLHLRIYQFQNLLAQHLPELTAHLDRLKVEPLYLSQWFLSFFGVTCPLPMLIRIFDVILTEGASETLMRVALSLMRRNEKKIVATNEFEDIMQFLLSRGIWDTYGCNADDLVRDFCTWTGLVTREGLQALETKFKDNQQSISTVAKPSVHTAASRFLGRLWASSLGSPKPANAATLTAPARPQSIRRTPSKQSMASTLNSIESSESNQSVGSTDATAMSRQPSADWIPAKQNISTTGTMSTSKIVQNKDKDLHSQIEDLLTALSSMQRERSSLEIELQREREEREEDRNVIQKVIERMKHRGSLSVIQEDGPNPDTSTSPSSPDLESAVSDLESHFAQTPKRSSIILQTKQQLREEVSRLKCQYIEETSRTMELTRQLTDRETELANSAEQLRDARARIADAYREKQRLERANRELKARKSSAGELAVDTSPTAAPHADSLVSPHSNTSGLREFKLGRTPSATSASGSLPTPTFSKRVSSLATQSVLATKDQRPANEDTLLAELVKSKTSEAQAREEVEEMKGRLETMRKLLGGTLPSPGSSFAAPDRKNPPSPVHSVVAGKAAEKEKVHTPGSASSSGGFFGGWGKRTASGTG